jgi:hypothetical protein
LLPLVKKEGHSKVRSKSFLKACNRKAREIVFQKIIPEVMAYTYEKRRERRTRQKALFLTLLLQALLVAGILFHGEIAEWMGQFLGWVQHGEPTLP